MIPSQGPAALGRCSQLCCAQDIPHRPLELAAEPSPQDAQTPQSHMSSCNTYRLIIPDTAFQFISIRKLQGSFFQHIWELSKTFRHRESYDEISRICDTGIHYFPCCPQVCSSRAVTTAFNISGTAAARLCIMIKLFPVPKEHESSWALHTNGNHFSPTKYCIKHKSLRMCQVLLFCYVPNREHKNPLRVFHLYFRKGTD